MAIFSKPLTISPTCYELGHCWTPYCRKASADVAGNVFKEALKIYGTLYLVAGILRKKGLKYYVNKFIPETLRSSIFLTINGTLFLSTFCIWRYFVGFYLYYNVYVCGIPACILSIIIEQKSRQMLGCMFFLTASFIPAYIAAFTAVLFERKSRRGPLAVYLTNLAIETGYRMLVERKLVTPVPNGEVYLFSAVSAVYLYLFRLKLEAWLPWQCPRHHGCEDCRSRKKDGLPQASESLFRFFVGKEENPQRSIKTSSGKQTRDKNANTDPSSVSENTGNVNQSLPSHQMADARTSQEESSSCERTSTIPSSSSSLPSSSSPPTSKGSRATVSKVKEILQRLPVVASVVEELEGRLREAWKYLEAFPKHQCCPHQFSCLSYTVKGGAKMFSFGYMVQAAINTLSVLPSILKKPSMLKNTLFSRLNLKLAAFLGGYSAIFRAVNCILRWLRNKDSEVHGCIAGALAGLSLRFYRSVTIALYAATKLMEILYFKGIETHNFPYIKSADIFIYAFSTAFIFHAAVMEPHTLRPGYWKFLLRVTNNKFAYMNRHLLDVFGVNSSKLQSDYWPDYDPAFTTLARPKS